jgi:hypothetical protein
MPRLRGEDNPQARLTEPNVRHILATEKYTPGLSKAFGVSRQQILRVRHRINWQHIQAEPQITA